MSIYQHDIDTDPMNPANKKGLDFKSCSCENCFYPVNIDDEFISCPSCGDLIVYIENDGREFTFNGHYYEELGGE